jgi:transcriptional regulator with XRE-family HTH domain
MNIYERIKELCKKKGVAIKEMEIAVGIGEKNANKWKTRTPSAESLLKLSEYFGVSTDYILTGEDNGVSKNYYFDQEIETIAQEIARHPGMKTLFEASMSLSDEDLQYVNDLIKRFKNK